MGLWEQRFQNAKKIPKTHERRWFKLLGGLCRNENYLNYKYTVVSSLEAADSALEQKRSQKLHLSHIAHYVINVQTIHILYILFILSILLIVVLFHLIYCSFYLLLLSLVGLMSILQYCTLNFKFPPDVLDPCDTGCGGWLRPRSQSI